MNYTIKFSDGEIWKGGDINNSRWNEMPNKNIVEINFSLGGKKIKLVNYNSYNLLIVHAMHIFTKENTIIKIILLAEENKTVEKFEFNFKHNNLNRSLCELNKEFNNKPTTGWKTGVVGFSPTYKIS
jgi:hypothetical protein